MAMLIVLAIPLVIVHDDFLPNMTIVGTSLPFSFRPHAVPVEGGVAHETMHDYTIQFNMYYIFH